MTPTEASEQIRRVMAAYCHRIDDRDLEGWANLFTADGTLEIGRRRYEGRTAIREWAEGSIAAAPEPGRHIVANPEIDVDGTTAIAVSDFMVLSSSMSVLVAGRYDDRLVAVDGSWSFADRRISFFRPAAS